MPSTTALYAGSKRSQAAMTLQADFKLIATGTPLDLTGCKARMQVRAEVESTEVLLELTTENGGITLGGVAGTIELFVSDDASTLFTWTAGVWDLEIEFPGGDVRRLAQGSISVSPEVTRG